MSVAATKATEKHGQNTNEEIGIAFPETTFATMAAQNGDRFNIAATMIGVGVSKPEIVKQKARKTEVGGSARRQLVP